MTQNEFSKNILKFLEINFPDFTSSVKYFDDDSFDCSLKSPSGIFSIWIATYNCEITIGLESPDGKTDIHKHISCYELDDFDNCTSELTRIIKEIMNNKTILFCDESNVYDWADLNRLLEKEKRKGKTYKKHFWNVK